VVSRSTVLARRVARFNPTPLGLSAQDVSVLNDEGASLLAGVVLRAISDFGFDTNQLHNDSTLISVHGVHLNAEETSRARKPTLVVTWVTVRTNAQTKQLALNLAVSADGAVPITYPLADGNTSDDATHVLTWDGLQTLIDFLYVSDQKLCSQHGDEPYP
jgi:hypothetical protein